MKLDEEVKFEIEEDKREAKKLAKPIKTHAVILHS